MSSTQRPFRGPAPKSIKPLPVVISAQKYLLRGFEIRTGIPDTHSPDGPTPFPHAQDCVRGCGVNGSGREKAMLVNTSQVPRPLRVPSLYLLIPPLRFPLPLLRHAG